MPHKYGRKAAGMTKAVEEETAAKKRRKKPPPGYHHMPDGSLMRNSAMKRRGKR